uniref:Galectin n=1 Tax=Meloidogyne javanica TaxID=6303 RepID=A0A915M0M2_MELJA
MSSTIDGPIVFNDLKIPSTINLESVGFGKGFYTQERIVFNGTISEDPKQFKIVLAEGGVNESNVQLDFTINFQAKLISVNNKFFTFFRRKDLSKISHLYVTGENTVQIKSLTLYHNNLKLKISTTEATTVPYQRCPKPIVLNNVLRITTWTVFGGWDGSSVYDNPFRVGEPFILEFIATPKDSIDIFVNNEFFKTIYYRKGYNDLNDVSQLYINGFQLNSLILCPTENL